MIWGYKGLDSDDDLMEQEPEEYTPDGKKIIRVKQKPSEYILPENQIRLERCLHKKRYKNIISKTIQFWYCPDCKEEVDE
jgi:hypothetical protein